MSMRHKTPTIEYVQYYAGFYDYYINIIVSQKYSRFWMIALNYSILEIVLHS